MQTNDAYKKSLVDFTLSSGRWENIDDVVMGGVSQSRLRIAESMAIFEGVVSLENHGGFASVRTALPAGELAGYDGILLRVRGDGKHYGFRLRPSVVRGGFGYEARFTGLAAQWSDEKLPFQQFRPVFKGREAPEYGPLDPGKVEVMGFIVSDKQAGPFRLEIKHIWAYKEPA
jgi:hypothetical protein